MMKKMSEPSILPTTMKSNATWLPYISDKRALLVQQRTKQKQGHGDFRNE
jgi:hypothetical protein